MKYKPLTPDQMVAVRAFAPFEVAEVFALWAARARAELGDRDPTAELEPEAMTWCGGLGPPVCMNETPEAFGLRCATALFYLIKEV